MEDVLDFSAELGDLDFSGDLAPKQTYGTGALGAMGIFGPVAEGGLRGLSTPFDLLGMGYNALVPDKYEIPKSYMPGQLLADAVYPQDIKDQVSAFARPSGSVPGTKYDMLGNAYDMLGKTPGTAANFVLSGGGLMNSISKLGQVAQASKAAGLAKVLETIGTYGAPMQKADAILGATAGTAGATMGDTAENVVALTPLAFASGKAISKVPYLGDALGYAAKKTGQGLDAVLGHIPSNLKDYAIRKVSEGKPQLASLLTQPTDQIASEFIQNVPGGSLNRDAAEFNLLQATADQLPDQSIAGRVSEIPLREARELGDEVNKIFPPGPVHDDATIGEAAQRVLGKLEEGVRGKMDSAYATALNNNKIPVNDSMRGVFKDTLSYLNKVTRRWVDPAPAIVKTKDMLRSFAGGKEKKGISNITSQDMDNIHKSLVDLQNRLDGSQQGMLGEVMRKLQDVAPDELKAAWTAAADHANTFLKPEASFASRLLKAQTVRGQGKQLITPQEAVTNLLRKATSRDFDELAGLMGDAPTRRLFQMALFPEISSYLQKGAKAAPRGSNAPVMLNQLKKFQGRKGLLEKVYGTNNYEKIAETYQKLANLADSRMQAKQLKVAPYSPVKQFQPAAGNTVLTLNTGGGVRGYVRPTSLFSYAYGGKQDEVNRIILNSLGESRGLAPVPGKVTSPAQSLAEALNPVARRAGTAPAMALLASLSGGAGVGDKPSLRTVPEIEAQQPAVLDFSGEDFGMVTSKSDVLDGKANDLLAKIEHVESRGNPKAVSPKGAKGVMQLMDSAIEEVAKVYGLDASKFDPFNEEQNRDWGAKYFAIMLDRFGGDEKLALAAYNGGEGYIRGLLNKHKKDSWAGILPYVKKKETKDYVKKIMG